MLNTCRMYFSYLFLPWGAGLAFQPAFRGARALAWFPEGGHSSTMCSVGPAWDQGSLEISAVALSLAPSSLAIHTLRSVIVPCALLFCPCLGAPKSFGFLGPNLDSLARLRYTALCSIPPTLTLALESFPPQSRFMSSSPPWFTRSRHNLSILNTSGAGATGGRAPLLKFNRWIYSEAECGCERIYTERNSTFCS